MATASPPAGRRKISLPMLNWLPPLAIATAWALATALAHHLGLGLHCDAGRTWQLLDLPELRDHLWQSLWHQHGQPPLFNLAVGLALKAGAAVDGAALHALFDGMGLAAGLLTWRVALRMGARPLWATLAAVLLIASPGFALYQHWMFYDLPVTVGILATALALVRAAELPTLGRLAALAACAAGLVWLRSVFHLAWLAGLAGAVLLPRDGRALPVKRLAATLAASLLVAALPFAKNWVVFGRFESSSWAGMSAQRLTHQFVPLAEREQMAARGEIAAVSVVGPYRPLAAYPPQPPVPEKWQSIAVLAQPEKQDGHPNFNHAAYVGISRTMLGDAVTLVRAHPAAYAQAHLSAWLHWLRPASVHPNLASGRQLLRPWLEPWNRWALLEWAQVHMAVVAGALLGLWLLLLGARPSAGIAAGLPPPARAMLRALAWTALWVTLLGNLLEHGENYRFRAYLDPVWMAVLAAAAGRIRLASRRGLPDPRIS